MLLLLLWPIALLAEALLDLLGGTLWWAVLAALVGWPLLARRWPRLWEWRGPEHGVRPLGAHATAALLVGLLAAPGERGTASRPPDVTATPSAGPGGPPRPVPAAPSRPHRPGPRACRPSRPQGRRAPRPRPTGSPAHGGTRAPTGR
ncbi:hypothetical protein [Streptomyces sp. NPDC059816]|uniref:hypothetical protein n=1 Tax=Streptomyces sp. NPDC059816 TaxID=3346960 RepID=UPI0036549F63